MTCTGKYCGLVVVFVAQFLIFSCSKSDPFEQRVKSVPNRVKVNGRGYILSENKPGIVDDDSIMYTADAGARTFNFETARVFRHLYVGQWQRFDSLPPDERRELREIARGAVSYIDNLEREQGRLSIVNQLHRSLMKRHLSIIALDK
jgi:hypothetical protein